MRKLYLDNIRWATVVLVMIYHVFYFFNAQHVLGGIGGFSEVQYQDSILYFIYPWFMILLFAVAGMSGRFSLEKYSAKEFRKMRTRTLLVPSTLGLIVFYWILGLMNLKVSNALDTIPSFMRYPISVLGGTGPLWFAQMLWIYSMAAPLLLKLDKENKFFNLCKKANYVVIILLGILIFLGSQVLNTPVVTVYRFGVYTIAYLIGFFVFSHDEVMDRIEKMHLPMLFIALALGIAYVIYYFGTPYADDAVLKSVFTNAYAWIMVIAILGNAKAYFDKQGEFAKRMTKANFGLYALHMIPITFAGYYLKTETSLNPVIIYILVLAAAFIITPVLYELIRRIPVLNYLVLGIKKENKEAKSKIDK